MRFVSALRPGTVRGAIVAAAAGAVALALAAGSTGAQTGNFSIALQGAQEVPPVTTTATGTFQGTLSGNSISYTLTATGSALTMAHFHQGAAGANGPVVAFLFGPNQAGVDSINESGTITVEDLSGPLQGNWDGFVAALDSGQIYVNVHSVANPGGEIRGQVPADQVTQPAATATTPATAAPATATAKPPATGSGTGGGSSDGLRPLGLALAAGVAIAAGAGVALRRR